MIYNDTAEFPLWAFSYRSESISYDSYHPAGAKVGRETLRRVRNEKNATVTGGMFLQKLGHYINGRGNEMGSCF